MKTNIDILSYLAQFFPCNLLHYYITIYKHVNGQA